MYIIINAEYEPGDELEPCQVVPCGEAETDGSYGYESHTHELNMALGEPPEGRYRHPLDWPSRKFGMQQIVYPTHVSYAKASPEVRTGLDEALAALDCDEHDGEPDTMPSWQLGSSI